MSRINTNISSLQAIHRLHTNNTDLATRLQRLSSGLKINTGKDAPAGLIASETLRSEINGIHQAIDNSPARQQRRSTPPKALLSEVSSLLLEVQSLTNEAANTGALSPEEIKANQLQVDAILNSDQPHRQHDAVQRREAAERLARLHAPAASTRTRDRHRAGQRGQDPGQRQRQHHRAGDRQRRARHADLRRLAASAPRRRRSRSPATPAPSSSASPPARTTAPSRSRSTSSRSRPASARRCWATGSSRFTRRSSGRSSSSASRRSTARSPNGKDFGVDAVGQHQRQRRPRSTGSIASVRTGDLDVTLTLDADVRPDDRPRRPARRASRSPAAGRSSSSARRSTARARCNIGIGSVATTKLGNDVVGLPLEPGQRRGELAGRRQHDPGAEDPDRRDPAGRDAARPARRVPEERAGDERQQPVGRAGERDRQRERHPRRRLRRGDRGPDAAQILVQANTSVLAQANASPQNVLALLGR